MITGELKSKIDCIWDAMWSGGISNPLSVIEQLTYLLFIKRLDELHTLQERKATRTGNAIEEPIYAPDQDHLRWSRFKEAAPEQMFATVRDDVFPFIKTLGDSEGNGSTYTHHMKDALFMMPTAHVLANVVDQLDGIDMADSDTKGDLYEYMLGKIASAGENGQFRTPRHIIKLMVDRTAPTPKDVGFNPGELLGCVSGGLGLRDWLESNGHTFVVTSDKDEDGCEMDRELVDADVVISQPFYPYYCNAKRIASAPNLKMAITAGIGSDHVDLQAAIRQQCAPQGQLPVQSCFNISKCFCPHCPNSLARPSPGYEWLARTQIVPALDALLRQ